MTRYHSELQDKVHSDGQISKCRHYGKSLKKDINKSECSHIWPNMIKKLKTNVSDRSSKDLKGQLALAVRHVSKKYIHLIYQTTHSDRAWLVADGAMGLK